MAEEQKRIILTLWVATRPLTFHGDAMHVAEQIRGLRAERFELVCAAQDVGELPALRHLLLTIDEVLKT